jgi:hypothetical protein
MRIHQSSIVFLRRIRIRTYFMGRIWALCGLERKRD